MKRRNFVRALGAIAVLSVVGSGHVLAQASDASVFIARLAEQAVTKLTGPGITPAERINRFRVMFNDGFDGKAIANFAIGRYQRVATEAELADYYKLFEDLIVQTYANRFAEYAGESLRVVGNRPGPDGDVIVASDLLRPNAPPVRVEWRVHRDEYGQKVNDIRVEGVSMIQIHRDDFAAVIQRGGGKVQALLDTLRNKTAANAANPGPMNARGTTTQQRR
jgi:phospholipid transport system substrate-binding protein